MENLNSNTEQILSNIERDNILRNLFEWKEWALDSSFLYKWKWAELYEKASTCEDYPFIDIEIDALKELKNDYNFRKILGKTDFITDVWSWDGQKAVTLLKWTGWHGTYIAEDPSEDMIKIVKENMMEHARGIKLWNFQVLNNKWHLSSNCQNNMYLFLWGTIWNMSDEDIIEELKNMDNSWIINGNKILLSYFTAPETQEDIDELIKIYGSENDRAFHENGIDMLWLSRDDFEYDVVYAKDNPEQKEWPFPWKIKWIIRAKRDNVVTLSSWRKISINQWQEFTLHYSRRFTKEWIEELFKKSGCNIIFTIDKKWDSVALLSKKPMKLKRFLKRNQKALLTTLVWLWIWIWGTTAIDQYNINKQKQRQDQLKWELELAHKSLDKSHPEEVNELIVALKLDDLKDSKDKKAIIDLFEKYLKEHENDENSSDETEAMDSDGRIYKDFWINTDEKIKWFYKEYGWYLIENFGLTHSPYDFMTPLLMVDTKNFGDELSITPQYTYTSSNQVKFWHLSSIDYWIIKAEILSQWMFKPYSFEYKDWQKTYLILKLKIHDSFKWTSTWTEIYVGAENEWQKTYPQFSTEVINNINDKNWLDPEILSNTRKLWWEFKIVNKIDSKWHNMSGNNNPYITLFNTNPKKILNTTNLNDSVVNYNSLYINWKPYYIITVSGYQRSKQDIWLASESPSWPYSTSTFNEIAKYFSIKRDMPLWYVHGHRRWR